MKYVDHEGLGNDATSTFRAFRTPAADGVRYADSGSVPDSGGPVGGWFPLAD